MSGTRKLQSTTALAQFGIGMEKLNSKHEHEPSLFKKLEGSRSGDPQGHWASAQATSGKPRSISGSKSRTKLLKQVVTGHKRLMALGFLQNLATCAKVRSLKLLASLVVDPAQCRPK